MAYTDDLQTALNKRLGKRVHYLPGWRQDWIGPWSKGRPVALLLHHTAGAATDSQNPAAKGNQHGANAGQVRYVNRHPAYKMPCSQFTLDRDGCVYVNAALPCYHAGVGSFTGTMWAKLGVPKDRFNSYGAGVEIISKGLSKDYTPAMKESLALLALAMRTAARWTSTGTLYLPRHKDWTDRKVDIKYENAAVQAWIAAATK